MDTKIQDIKKRGTYSGNLTVRQICTALMYLALGAIMGRAELPFGAMPFGLALFCSASTYALAALGGTLLSVVGMSEAIPLLCAYAVAALLRLIFSLATRENRQGQSGFFERIFCEPFFLRAIAAGIAAFALGAYRLAIGGFLYYDLFGMLVTLGVAILGTLALSPLSRAGGANGSSVKRFFWYAGYVALCAAAVFSLRGYSPYGVSLSALACMLLTLYTTKRRGVSLGVLVGMTSGLCVSVVYAPLFIFASVCYGLLSSVSATLGCFSAFAAGIAWGVYMNGISAFLSLFSALMSATLLFLVADRLFLSGERTHKNAESRAEASPEAESVAVLDGSEIAVARFDDSARRIKELCMSLSSLSESLLGETDGEERIDDGSRRGKSVLFAEIGEEGVVVKKSGVKTNGKPRKGKQRSYAIEELADISPLSAEGGKKESFALDLAAISDYIADIMVGNDSDYQPDESLAAEISSALKQGFKESSFRVGVFGGHRRRILICCDDISRLRADIGRIERYICKRFDMALEAREPFELGGRAYAVLERRAVLGVSFAQRKRSASGQTLCGDSVGTVTDEGGGRAYAFISDGMGSGREAARASQICTTFLDKLLPINEGSVESVRSTLGVINSFIRRQNGSSAKECSATVDLGVFDLIEGRVSFYKSGAAPTFVFRDGSLFKLRTRSVPIGIIQEPDFGRANMELLPGDVLVMVSDGVTDGREESPELFELLRSRLMTHSAEQLADAVIEYAERIGCTDDVSVIVAKIDDLLFF